eukprot:2565239-Pleurochrysis_carterae.AAC.2
MNNAETARISRNTSQYWQPAVSCTGIVHDNVAHREEQPRPEGFREEIREIVDASDERDCDMEVLDLLPHNEVAPVNVLGA